MLSIRFPNIKQENFECLNISWNGHFRSFSDNDLELHLISKLNSSFVNNSLDEDMKS